MYKIMQVLLAICCVILTLGDLWAQTISTQWLDDQTVAVVRINLKDPNTQDALTRLIQSLPPAANELKVWQSQLQAIGQSITASGGEELLIVYSLADDFQDQPLWVAPKSKNLDLKPFLRSILGSGALSPERRSMTLKRIEMSDSTIVGTSSAIERVKANKSEAPQPLRDMFQQPGSTVTVFMTLNADQRRAATEMMPQVPPFLGSGKTRDLLAQVQWLQLDLIGQSPANLVLTVTGDTAAVETRWKSIKGWLDGADNANSAPLAKSIGKFILEQMVAQPPKRQGQTITWKVPVEGALKSGASEVLSAALLQADEFSASRQLRSLALAIHNHYSAMKRLPSPLSGLDGKSPRKLSWRIDLLPFLDENDLYQQFHLDEAWDSPHNRTLIPRMPSVFRVPQSKHQAESGLSTFVLPSNADSMWPADRALDFKDIEDGTSNTIMIVEVNDDLAQEWTKPDPFQINMQDPASQLGGHFIDKIFFAAGDGSSGTISRDKFGDLKALLTRSGGESVSW